MCSPARASILLLALLSVLLASLGRAQDGEDPPTVVTNSGPVLGSWTQSWNGRRIASFNGIPYAKPPVGELRFLAPEPAEPWEGTLDASGPGSSVPICYQAISGGEEDCLYLYLHAPEQNEGLLPVMVFLHGGALKAGNGATSINPDFLADYGVILVSLNYRLGAFGFLTVEDTDVTGNQGFRDQALALTWLQENIEFFGGDPNQVTLFGESAGSWSVMHQILNPGASGLFSYAMGESGTPIGTYFPYRSEEEAIQYGLQLIEDVACDGQDDPAATVECLQQTPPELLALLQYEARGVVDGGMSPNPVLPETPGDLLTSGDFNQVPVLMGANSAEAVLFISDILINPERLDNIGERWDYWGPVYVFDKQPEEATQEEMAVAENARDFYFAPDGIVDQTKLEEFVQFRTDVLYQYNVHTFASALSVHVPVYQYVLIYTGSLSYVNKTGLPTNGFTLGASHTDDLSYLFRTEDASAYQGDSWDEQDETVRLRMCQLWTNFAKFGNPTPADNQYPELEGFAWTPVTDGDGFRYVEVGPGDLVMTESQDYSDRMQFWDGEVVIL